MADRMTDIHQSKEYIELIFDSFTELCGDRKSGNDPAVIGGLAKLGNHKLVAISYQPTRSDLTPDSLAPTGYRKSTRLMKLAEYFHKPVITLTDVPVLPSLSISEQQKLDESIARNVKEMSRLNVPVISVIMGESNDIRAIDLCAADRVIMMDDESCNISSSSEKTWAIGLGNESLCFKTQQLLDLNIVHKTLTGSSQEDQASVAYKLRDILIEELNQLSNIKPDILVEHRLERLQNQFLSFAVFGSLSNAIDKIS